MVQKLSVWLDGWGGGGKNNSIRLDGKLFM